MSDTTPNYIYDFLINHPNLKEKKSNLKYSQKNIIDDKCGYRFTFKCNNKLIVNQIVPTHITHTPSPCEWGYIHTKQIHNILTEEEIINVNESKTLGIHTVKFNRLIELISILININNTF